MNTVHTSTTKRSLVRLARPVSIALAAAMALAPATAFLDVAHAQSDQVTPPISLIDSALTTTLTINKIDGDPEVNGQAGALNKPMPGIVFDIYQLIGMNPANAEDWEDFAELDPTSLSAAAGSTMSLSDTVTTGADGSVTSSALPVGFYFVKERASDGVVPAPPFLISLPMTDQATLTDWDYNPSVKPKNQTLGLIKRVTDQDIIESESEALTYILEGGVPAIATAGYSFDRYIITDDFDEDHVAVNDTTHEVRFVLPDGEVVETLTRNADYQIANNGDTATMSLTTDGLRKLEVQRGGDSDQFGQPELKVEWSFDAEIIEFNEAGAGLILNNAILEPPRAPNVEVADIPSNTVVTEMIEISVHKADADTLEDLAGAEFGLYRCNPGSNDLYSERILDTATSNAVGMLTFTSVQIPDFANDADRTPEWGYCLVEIEAPEGYELIPEPLMVDLAGIDAGTNTITYEAVNYLENGGNPLPVTGEHSLLWLSGGAGVLVLGGIVYVIRRRNDMAHA